MRQVNCFEALRTSTTVTANIVKNTWVLITDNETTFSFSFEILSREKNKEQGVPFLFPLEECDVRIILK